AKGFDPPPWGHTTDDGRCRHSNPEHQHKNNPDRGPGTCLVLWPSAKPPWQGPDQKPFI
ncbi:hypothetical protein CEXT_367591, partial [Caerostris extrusa]